MNLKDIWSCSLKNVARLDKSIVTILKSISELKQSMVDYNFKDDKEEIHFFKNVKPKFVSQLIYYAEMRNIEIDKPLGRFKTYRRYLKGHLKSLNQFFARNKDLYRYYRSSYTHLDEFYFLRRKIDWSIQADPRICDSNFSFSTNHDYTWAQITGYDLLSDSLNKSLAKLELETSETAAPQNTLKWTGSKTALIELIYSLQSVGALNNSQADLKLIFDTFEQVFDVKLGNYYRTFQEIRIRKIRGVLIFWIS